MSNADVVGLQHSSDSFRSPFDVRYSCSSDRCRVSVRSVRLGVSVSVVSNKVPFVIALVENVV